MNRRMKVIDKCSIYTNGRIEKRIEICAFLEKFSPDNLTELSEFKIEETCVFYNALYSEHEFLLI